MYLSTARDDNTTPLSLPRASSPLPHMMFFFLGGGDETSPKNPFPAYGMALLWGQNQSEVVKCFEKGKALKFKIVLLFVVRCFPSKKRKKKKSDSLRAISRKWFSAGFCFFSSNPTHAELAEPISKSQMPPTLQMPPPAICFSRTSSWKAHCPGA